MNSNQEYSRENYYNEDRMPSPYRDDNRLQPTPYREQRQPSPYREIRQPSPYRQPSPSRSFDTKRPLNRPPSDDSNNSDTRNLFTSLKTDIPKARSYESPAYRTATPEPMSANLKEDSRFINSPYSANYDYTNRPLSDEFSDDMQIPFHNIAKPHPNAFSYEDPRYVNKGIEDYGSQPRSPGYDFDNLQTDSAVGRQDSPRMNQYGEDLTRSNSRDKYYENGDIHRSNSKDKYYGDNLQRSNSKDKYYDENLQRSNSKEKYYGDNTRYDDENLTRSNSKNQYERDNYYDNQNLQRSNSRDQYYSPNNLQRSNSRDKYYGSQAGADNYHSPPNFNTAQSYYPPPSPIKAERSALASASPLASKSSIPSKMNENRFSTASHADTERYCCGFFTSQKQCMTICGPISVILFILFAVGGFFLFPRLPSFEMSAPISTNVLDMGGVPELMAASESKPFIATFALRVNINVSSENYINWKLDTLTVTGYIKDPETGNAIGKQIGKGNRTQITLRSKQITSFQMDFRVYYARNTPLTNENVLQDELLKALIFSCGPESFGYQAYKSHPQKEIKLRLLPTVRLDPFSFIELPISEVNKRFECPPETFQMLDLFAKALKKK
ncbi:hypothetical protein BC833DRAFT_646492 [Globomyces pollinis-pini]|nr:hypothetical protein BC833DRAFT_646492 [Globomyces pollinis-pini]